MKYLISYTVIIFDVGVRNNRSSYKQCQILVPLRLSTNMQEETFRALTVFSHNSLKYINEIINEIHEVQKYIKYC